MLILWRSEIRPSLDSKWSKRGWVANGLDFEWNLKSRSDLKSGQMAAILSKNHLNSRQKLPDFEWSGFRMVGTTALAQPF